MRRTLSGRREENMSGSIRKHLSLLLIICLLLSGFPSTIVNAEGTVNNNPLQLQSATVNKYICILKYNMMLNPIPIPNNSAYSVNVNGIQEQPRIVLVLGKEIHLILKKKVKNGQDVTISYNPKDRYLHDFNGNKADAFSNYIVANITREKDEPELVTATIEENNINLFYNELLDITSVPSVNKFSINNGTGNKVIIKSTTIQENIVNLKIDVSANANENWTISYNPGLLGKKIKDLAGNSAAKFNNYPITFIQPLQPEQTITPSDIKPSQASGLLEDTQFLYSGENAVQKGLNPQTLVEQRAAIIRGKVLTNSGEPLAGVLITIADHPEFGSTASRMDGCFDMALNGGDCLRVNYRKVGYIPVQRKIEVPWQDYAIMPEVVMTPYDENVTVIQTGSNSPEQIARGSKVVDEDGSRQATMLISQGTGANLVLKGGARQAINSLNIRVTEYTVGNNGPEAMPGELPANVGYTYAVEFSADQAEKLGAEGIEFNKPVTYYVENFLNFPVGGIVPVGYYDHIKQAWIPQNNGKIIAVLDIIEGEAVLDVNGNGQAATSEELDTLAITPNELQRLAELYQPGQSLWRVTTKHFSPIDLNWPIGPVPGATPPPDYLIPIKCNDIDDPCFASGSIIEIQNQTLGESKGIHGTPYSINYSTKRIQGFKSRLNIPLTGDSINPALKSVILQINIAGNTITKVFPAQPNQSYEFIWDGTDGYGRSVKGEQFISVNIGYVYPGAYQIPSNSATSFGDSSGVSLNIPSRQDAVMWKAWTGTIKPTSDDFIIAVHNLGGWTLDICHAYDPFKKMLYLGNGSQKTGESLYRQINTYAGTGEYGYGGDGGAASEAKLLLPTFTVMAGDGTLFIADTGNSRIRKVTPDGTISNMAGIGLPGFSGDGLSAKLAMLKFPTGLAVGKDGSIYIADTLNNRIRCVDPNGKIRTVVGTGAAGYTGDEGLATNAQIHYPVGISLDNNGNLYIADFGNHSVRKVGPDGIIKTVVGNGIKGTPVFNIPAKDAQLDSPLTVSVGEDGDLYVFSAGNGILKIGTNGIISPAVMDESNINRIENTSISLSNTTAQQLPVDLLPIFDEFQQYLEPLQNFFEERDIHEYLPLIEYVAPYFSSVITTGEDGSYYFSNPAAHKVYRIGTTIPHITGTEYLIPSEDGSEVYLFNKAGQHQKTVDAINAETIFEFSYDTGGNLVTVTDMNGNATTIERDVNGMATAIIAPGGQRNAISINENGLLSAIACPLGFATNLEYDDNKLLTKLVDHKGNAYSFTYDEEGRLIKDENPAGGFTELKSSYSTNGWTVTTTTAMGRISNYSIEKLPDGSKRYSNTFPGGATASAISYEGNSKVIGANGTITETLLAPDPRWGMEAPIIKKTTVKTPQGLEYTAESQRQVTLQNPRNILNVQSISDVNTINGKTYSSSYDANSRQITSVTPQGRKSIISVDTKGRVIKEEIPGLEGVDYSYNEAGLLVAVRQGNKSVNFTYDDKKRVSSVTNAAGETTSYSYNDANLVTSMTLPAGNTYRFGYDLNGNRNKVIMPNGAIHELEHTVINLGQSYAPPANPPYINDYNLDNEMVRIILPSGKSIDTSYDNAGRMSGSTYEDATINMEYRDNTDRVSVITRSPAFADLINITSSKMIKEGVPVKDGNIAPGKTNENTDRADSEGIRDISGEQNNENSKLDTEANDSNNGGIYNNTDTSQPNGELLEAIEANETTTNTVINDNNVIAETNQEVSVEDTEPSNIHEDTIISAQDENYSEAITPDNIQNRLNEDLLYTLNQINNQKILYDYDGDLVTKTEYIGAVNGKYQYRYDNDFNLAGIRLNDREEISIIRDDDGLVTSYGPFNYTRSGPGGATERISNGIMDIEINYDSDGRVQTRTHSINGQEIYRLNLQYNNIGKIGQKTESTASGSKTSNYTYDSNGQLIQVTENGSITETYAYDSNLNRTSANNQIASYDQQDRLLQQGQTNYNFDQDGFMTQRGNEQFTYSTTGELLKVSLENGINKNYIYDGTARQTGHIDSSGKYEYLYGNPDNPFQITAVREPNGALSNYYYDTNGYLIAIEKNENWYYVATDQLDTPKIITDASGQTIKSLEYDSYGKRITDSNPDFYLPQGFAGGIEDKDSGLVRFGMRDYDTTSGRWTARDPIFFEGGQGNLFIYVGNDPVNFLDPFGMQLMEWDNLGRTFRETGEYLVSDEAVTAYKQTGVSVCAVTGGALLASGGSAVATARYAELLRKTDHVAVTGIKQIGVRYGNTAENALSKVYYGPLYKVLNSPPNRPLSEAKSELKKKIKSFTDKQRNK